MLIALGILALMLRTPGEAVSEIEKIKSLTTTEEQQDVLLELLERVGPIEAQEEMLRSGLPFTGETHLLVHVIGDYVYDKYGLDGLQYCKDYFLSACYHGFILNTLGDHGLSGVAEVMERCKDAPPGVLSQCAHAAGHGFVAWHDYDLLKGAEMCDALGEELERRSPASSFSYFNCYDGVFMENVWGVHDGAPSEKRWVKTDDIYYPCNDPRIPEKYLGGCWSNQATLIYQHSKGDLKKTALACDAVENEEYRDICYNNWARQIHPITNGKKEKVFSLCSLATGKERQDQCVIDNMGAYLSVGDRDIPFEICESTAGELENRCFERLSGMINYYYKDKSGERELYCRKISSKIHENKCLER